MANPYLVTPSLLTSDPALELFVGGDIYRYDIDNRPLRKLLLNDQAVAGQHDDLSDEVYEARTDATPFAFGTLKERLDSMDLSSGFAPKVVLFDLMHDLAAVRRSRQGSGFFCRVGDVYDANDVEGVWPTGGADVDKHIPFGAICVKNRAADVTSTLADVPDNSVWISPRHDSATPDQRPIEALLAGYHIRLYDESANSATASGMTGGVSVLLPAGPGSGHRFDLAFLEFWLAPVAKLLDDTDEDKSFYPYGAVDANTAKTEDASLASIRGTVFFHPGNGGDYVQIRHRIRVVSGIDAEANPFGMSDALVLAQGGAGSPVAAKTFANGLGLLGDAAIWVAGDGSGGDITALGSIDGRVYAVPMFIASRRNTGAWSLSNQNGGTGRPDGLLATAFVRGDIVDLRPQGATDRTDLQEAADGALDRLLRGKLRTAFGQLAYDTDVFGDFVTKDPRGTELTAVDWISDTQQAGTNPVRDFTADEPPTADPDGVRRVWSPTGDSQVVGFHVPMSGSPGATPTGFAVRTSASVLTLSAGANRTFVGTPVVSWRSDQTLAVGTWVISTDRTSAVLTLATGDTNYDAAGIVDGAAVVQMPRSTGLRRSPNRVAYQEYVSATSDLFPTTRVQGLFGPNGICVDSSGNMFVCDTSNMRVIKYDDEGTKLGQFGVTGVSGADNSHLHNPQGVAVDGSGNIYVADWLNHRVVKLSPSLPTFTYTSQFGTTATPGNNTSQLDGPLGIAVDSSGNVYISDYNNARIVKLDNTLTYAAQFGVSSPPTFGADSTHVVAPRGLCIGGDGNLYVADQTRVLVIDPSDMSLLTVIAGGTGIPEGPSAAALAGIRTVSVAQDGSGNIYVAGGGTTAVYKFNSSYTILARFGTPGQVGDPATSWDGSLAQSTSRVGATYTVAYDANGGSPRIWLTDFNFASPTQSRILVLDASDLSFVSQKFLTNPRPWMDDVSYPSHPYPAYPLPWAGKMALDAAGKKFYLPIINQSVVEKWSYSDPDDPNTWTFTSKFGTISNDGSAWVGWRNQGDNSTRLANPLVCELDGSGALYVAESRTAAAQGATGGPGGPQVSSAAGGGLPPAAYAGRVTKLATGMTWSAQFGDLSVLNGDATGTTYMYYPSGLVWAASRLYVTDAYCNPPRLLVLGASAFDSGDGDPAQIKAVVRDLASWQSSLVSTSFFLCVSGKNTAGNALYINPGDNTQTWSIASADAPVRSLFATGAVTLFRTQHSEAFRDVEQVWHSDNVLLIADAASNLIYALSTPDYYPIGRAGTPGVSAFGLGGWARPSGIAYDGDYLYLCDSYNNHLLKAPKFFAFVERGSGRVETLFAPPTAAQLHLYSRYTPYQGVLVSPTFLGEADHLAVQFFGSRFLHRPRKLLVTTRGRVGLERASLRGDVAYADPLAHLPMPQGGGTDYSWAAAALAFASGVLGRSSLAVLPVLQTASNPLTYAQDSESAYDPDTLMASFYGDPLPGGGAPSGLPYNDSSPTYRTFDLVDPVPRLVYAYAVAEYKGEMLLFVRGDLVAGTDNGVALQTQAFPQVANVVEVFRMPGHPFAAGQGTR